MLFVINIMMADWGNVQSNSVGNKTGTEWMHYPDISQGFQVVQG